MVPFFVLIAAFLTFRAVGYMGGSLLDSWPSALRPALAVMFLLTASAHFAKGPPISFAWCRLRFRDPQCL